MGYMDYNATTPLACEAMEAMLPWLGAGYGNPSSIHSEGRAARVAVDDARERIAGLLGARPHEIIFTSGGTESCNLAVLGLVRAARVRGDHIITPKTEHHAVLHACGQLLSEGFDVTWLDVDSDGLVDVAAVEEAIRPETVLVSVMHANNETGAIQPVEELAALCASRGVLFHTDAVQSFGKLPLALDSGISAASFAAHKFYGPKGSGFLWLRAGHPIERIGHGGSHENARRPGTENVPAIVGMAVAAELADAMRESEARRLEPLREELWQRIVALAPEAVRNGSPQTCLPNTLNVSFPGCDGEALLIGLDLEGISASSGSACMVGTMQASHVVLAMGADPATAAATVRFSLGRETTRDDITACASALEKTLARQPTTTP
jgi:cysteine desulfurase